MMPGSLQSEQLAAKQESTAQTAGPLVSPTAATPAAAAVMVAEALEPGIVYLLNGTGYPK